MDYNDDITKLQEQIELLKKQKEKSTVDLSTYLINFDTVVQIEDEVTRLCEEIILYRNTKSYAYILNNIDINNPKIIKLEDPNILLNIDLSLFEKIKDMICKYNEPNKINNRYGNPIFTYNQNNLDVVIFDKILKLITIVVNIKHPIEKEKYSIYKCYPGINNYFSIGNIQKKYEVDHEIIDELEYDLNIIKMFYLDSIAFIKLHQRLLSEYPNNFEKITQLKIIELNKKKISLI